MLTLLMDHLPLDHLSDFTRLENGQLQTFSEYVREIDPSNAFTYEQNQDALRQYCADRPFDALMSCPKPFAKDARDLVLAYFSGAKKGTLECLRTVPFYRLAEDTTACWGKADKGPIFSITIQASQIKQDFIFSWQKDDQNVWHVISADARKSQSLRGSMLPDQLSIEDYSFGRDWRSHSGSPGKQFLSADTLSMLTLWKR